MRVEKKPPASLQTFMVAQNSLVKFLGCLRNAKLDDGANRNGRNGTRQIALHVYQLN